MNTILNRYPGTKTLVMRILNVTPDSFSDGYLYFGDVAKAVARVEQMIEEGADIIDSGFTFDNTFAGVVAVCNCTIVIYHIKGEPQTTLAGPIVYNDVIDEIAVYFRKEIYFGLSKGMKREQFILYPGIGFGKTLGHNLEIIKRLLEFKKLNLPLLVGVSRKGHLGKFLQRRLGLEQMPRVSERLEASLAETAVAVLNGASIVRTHDVLPTVKFLTVLDALKNEE